MSNIQEIYEHEIKDRERLSRRLHALLRGVWRLGVTGLEKLLIGVITGMWSGLKWWFKWYLRLVMGYFAVVFGVLMIGSSHAGHLLQGEELDHFLKAALQWVTAGWR